MERIRPIPIRQLVDSSGTVAEDIVASTGALLLPKGTELRWIQSSLPSIIRRLGEAGISHVAVQDSLQVSLDDLEAVLETISTPHLAQVDHQLARHTTRQIGDVYSRIENRQVTQEDMGHLVETGKTGGGNPGGGGDGAPGRDGAGATADADAEARDVEKVGGVDRGAWPAEFREALEGYYRALEAE